MFVLAIGLGFFVRFGSLFQFVDLFFFKLDFSQAGLQFDDRFSFLPHVDDFPHPLAHSAHTAQFYALLI